MRLERAVFCLALVLVTFTSVASAQPAPALSDDELIEAFMREFDAEELPADEES